MAKYGPDDVAFILVDGYSIGGYLNALQDSQEATIEETHCWGDTWVERSFTGEKKAALSMGGFFDDADNATNEAFVDQYGVRTICYCFEGNTVGKNVTMLYGPTQGKYERIASRGALHKANVSFEGSGEVEDGKIIATHTARTTAGDTTATSVDNSAASTVGGAIYLQVSALTLGGYTNLAVKLQDSSDNISFADVTGGGFTAVTAAPAAERKALTGAIKQYTAVVWSWTGSGSDQTATFMVGLHRNPEPA